MTKITIEHKHSDIFKIFKRNTTPQDRIDQLLELHPSKVIDCIVDLIELYNGLQDDLNSNARLLPLDISRKLHVDA